MSQLLIDVVGYGSGPVSAAGSWEWSWELDQAGAIAFPISVADKQAQHLDTDREVRAYLLRDGAPRLAVGAGTIEEIGDEVTVRGTSKRQISGSDLLIELGDRTVGNLLLSDGADGPMAAANVPAAIMAFAPPGWSVSGSLSRDVALRFEGESVLAAWGKVIEQTGDHFMLAGPTSRQLVIRSSATPTSSGVRAVQDGDPTALRTNPRVCLIKKLKRTKDAAERYTRIYAYGAGNNKARVTLDDGTWTPPAGYTLDLAANCMIHTASDTARRRDHYESFKDLTVVGNGTVATVNALRMAAYEALRRHIAPLRSYDLEVTKLDVQVEPGQTMRVVYTEFVNGTKTLAIDEDLYILAVKQRIDRNGRSRTVGLTVASSDRWPASDAQLQIRAISQARSMDAHEQPAVRAQTAANIATNANATVNNVEINDVLDHDGTTFGLYGVTPVARPTIIGSRGGNAALASLLTALASQGIVIDGTTV